MRFINQTHQELSTRVLGSHFFRLAKYGLMKRKGLIHQLEAGFSDGFPLFENLEASRDVRGLPSISVRFERLCYLTLTPLRRE
jgi:hypothetical protein